MYFNSSRQTMATEWVCRVCDQIMQMNAWKKREVDEQDMQTEESYKANLHVESRAWWEATPTSCMWLSRQRMSLNKDRNGGYWQTGREKQDDTKRWWQDSMKTFGLMKFRCMKWWAGECTWLSTSIAMSTNMSCNSFILLSRRTMSLWRASISLSACLEIPESTIYKTHRNNKIINTSKQRTPFIQLRLDLLEYWSKLPLIHT